MSHYQVLLYYQYTTINQPENFAKEHLALCQKLNLKGRILVAKEGINGTLAGTTKDTKTYMKWMHDHPLFKETIFKIDSSDTIPFKKMFVRPRSELVTLNLDDDINPLELTGTYLSPSEFREAILDEDTVVIDARNSYEYDLGHFRGAIRPNIKTFRELPQWIRDHKDKLMEKRIVTYCTGGIRCEKFSGWLIRDGFKQVGQLHGGIVTYGKDPTTKGDLWDGQMYVFDERISVSVNQLEHVIVGKDWFDDTPCERYVNCSNPSCNRQMLCSEEHEAIYLRGCSTECRCHPNNRYVIEHQLSIAQWQERLEAIGESLPSEMLKPL